MMGPLYKFGHMTPFCGMIVAVVLGFWFGYVLERAGFGNPRKLTAVFYLRDFAVLKVMFTAIVVAMIGLFGMARLGWIDLSKVYLLPTFVWPQLVGGLLLGVGFVMGGYCPTTSIVASVSGKWDGLVFVLGMMTGAWLFAELFPAMQGFYLSGNLGQVRLSDIFPVSIGILVFAVCVMALAAFALGEHLERRFGEGEVDGNPSRRFKLVAGALLLIAGVALAVAGPTAPPAKTGGPPEAGSSGRAPVVGESVPDAPSGQPGEIVTPHEQEQPVVIMGDDEGC